MPCNWVPPSIQIWYFLPACTHRPATAGWTPVRLLPLPDHSFIINTSLSYFACMYTTMHLWSKYHNIVFSQTTLNETTIAVVFLPWSWPMQCKFGLLHHLPTVAVSPTLALSQSIGPHLSF